jgi:hypothetical protein
MAINKRFSLFFMVWKFDLFPYSCKKLSQRWLNVCARRCSSKSWRLLFWFMIFHVVLNIIHASIYEVWCPLCNMNLILRLNYVFLFCRKIWFAAFSMQRFYFHNGNEGFRWKNLTLYMRFCGPIDLETFSQCSQIHTPICVCVCMHSFAYEIWVLSSDARETENRA